MLCTSTSSLAFACASLIVLSFLIIATGVPLLVCIRVLFMSVILRRNSTNSVRPGNRLCCLLWVTPSCAAQEAVVRL